jgi:peptide/nickel transport system permease protein
MGLSLLCLILLASLLGPLLSPYDIARTDFSVSLQPPSSGHWLGTDIAGRDVFTLLLSAGRVSLLVALGAASLQLVLGVALGLLSGYLGGAADKVIRFVIDVFLSLPMLLVLLLASVLLSQLPLRGTGRTLLVAAVIGALSWPNCARLVRGETLRIREECYTTAAAAAGLAPGQILLGTILPNLLPQIAVTATFAVGDAVIAESVLSFLGLGVSAPLVSWGSMIQSMTRLQDFRGRPWLWLGAGVCIFLCVLAFHLIGEGLRGRDSLDKR